MQNSSFHTLRRLIIIYMYVQTDLYVQQFTSTNSLYGGRLNYHPYDCSS